MADAGEHLVTGRPISNFAKTAHRYRSIELRPGDHVIAAAAPLPGDLRLSLARSTRPSLPYCETLYEMGLSGRLMRCVMASKLSTIHVYLAIGHGESESQSWKALIKRLKHSLCIARLAADKIKVKCAHVVRQRADGLRHLPVGGHAGMFQQ
jgi:hypothetical protein